LISWTDAARSYLEHLHLSYVKYILYISHLLKHRSKPEIFGSLLFSNALTLIGRVHEFVDAYVIYGCSIPLHCLGLRDIAVNTFNSSIAPRRGPIHCHNCHWRLIPIIPSIVSIGKRYTLGRSSKYTPLHNGFHSHNQPAYGQLTSSIPPSDPSTNNGNC